MFHCLLIADCCLLFNACGLWFVGWRLLCVVRGLRNEMFVVCCLLLFVVLIGVDCRVLFVARCVLFVVGCVLFVVCCLLFVAWFVYSVCCIAC